MVALKVALVHLTLLMVHWRALVSTIQDATKGSSKGTSKGVLWDLCKNAQEGEFEI